MRINTFIIFGCFAICCSVAPAATITVNAADNIYGAAQSSPPGGGNSPGFITLGPGVTSVTFSSVTGSLTCASSEGCITLNGNGNFNDPDGNGAAVATSSNTGTHTVDASISGITAPGAGYLLGLFVPDGGPLAPALALDYTTTSSASSMSYSPRIDQTFFIGDGLTGDGTGSQQTFNVPLGAVSLYLGISDAGNYNGNPGSYGDNLGTYTVNYSLNGAVVAPTPEPGSLLLLGGGLVGFVFARRRRKN